MGKSFQDLVKPYKVSLKMLKYADYDMFIFLTKDTCHCLFIQQVLRFDILKFRILESLNLQSMLKTGNRIHSQV